MIQAPGYLNPSYSHELGSYTASVHAGDFCKPLKVNKMFDVLKGTVNTVKQLRKMFFNY